MHRLLLLALIGCGSTESSKTTNNDELLARGDCDPIAPTLCGLPFPSTFYMAEDDASPTGWRIALGETTLPTDTMDRQPSPTLFNEKDGWSPLTPLLAHFPGVSLDGLIGHDNIGAYTDAEAKTVIVDVETGERVPHFVELDATADDPDKTMLIVHTVSPMAHGHRYAVGFRNLIDEAGDPIVPSEAFVQLRDDIASNDAAIQERRDVYEDVVFPALEATGFQRDELILAWDFVVASRQGITDRAVWIRDDALDRVGPTGPEYIIDSIEDKPSEDVAMRLHGHFYTPLYTEKDQPGVLLTRDEDGMPYANGETRVRFTIIVPQTAIDDPRPLPIIQYGHGLLGSRSEVGNGYLGEFANNYGYILFAVDWTGMKSEDVSAISLMLVTEIDHFSILPERTLQGFSEFAVAMRLMAGRMVEDENLQAVDANGNNISLIDPDLRYYYGNSQGAILGGAYIALSQDIERAVLGVGGSPYHILLNRSADFDPFFLLFKNAFPDPAHIQYILALIQTIWDTGESSGYAQFVTRDPLPNTPEKDVLLQVAIGDAQVTTLGAHVMARAYGAKLVDTPARPVWGLETVPSGHVGSALVEFDYGLEVPFENLPPDPDTDPHENPRRDAAGQEQIHMFFEEGIIVNHCEGPCGDSSR